MIKIAITGSAGRMGRRIAALAIESEQFDIVSAMEIAGHGDIGKDVGELAGVGAFGVEVSSSLDQTPDVLIDFSTPQATMAMLKICRDLGVAMVVGTTGLTDSQRSEIADSASGIAIVHAPNMSVGVNVLLKVAAEVAAVLGRDYDIEISETHHRFKKDAPSGTAIALARSICASTGRDYDDAAVFGRSGQCPRSPGQIGMHALRVGDTVGEHTVHFGNLGETITLGHCAHTRDNFAIGSLRAANWVAARPAGLYDMQDVLGLR